MHRIMGLEGRLTKITSTIVDIDQNKHPETHIATSLTVEVEKGIDGKPIDKKITSITFYGIVLPDSIGHRVAFEEVNLEGDYRGVNHIVKGTKQELRDLDLSRDYIYEKITAVTTALLDGH